jgi:hypothetical protein
MVLKCLIIKNRLIFIGCFWIEISSIFEDKKIAQKIFLQKRRFIKLIAGEELVRQA